MSFFSRLDRHERLMSRMAERNGSDLAYAMQAGALGPETYRGAVLSCTGCSNPGDCQDRLDTDVPGIPDYCRNAPMLRRLAKSLPG